MESNILFGDSVIYWNYFQSFFRDTKFFNNFPLSYFYWGIQCLKKGTAKEVYDKCTLN